jgi:hypothetical protein
MLTDRQQQSGAMAFEPQARLAYLCGMESDDPEIPEDTPEDLPDAAGDDTVDDSDDVANDLPDAVELEMEEISSGVDLHSADGIDQFHHKNSPE